VPRISGELGQRLYERAAAARWSLPVSTFLEALESSVHSALARNPRLVDAPSALERYLRGLHLEDLALACACSAGDERAWEHFIREQRQVLYRAADALDPTGGGRELADSIYADLFGTAGAAGERRSLFRYFHGRSSLSTWLRAVLAQRHVDAIRSRRRLDPLPDEDSPILMSAAAPPADPDRVRYLAVLHRILSEVIGALPARDRLRLSSYYAQQLTLAQIGRISGEHEATVSRQLARTRRSVRDEVARRLRDDAKLDDAQVERCLEYALEDPGTLDLDDIIRKDSESDRSI
jgi:RNA polymerase sigma factor (sigma-70 family)